MQIKIIKFLLVLSSLVFAVPAMAGLPDCKRTKDSNGAAVRKQDLKKNPAFKNAKFYTNICDEEKKNCVKMFSGLQVQNMGQAVHIAKDYALKKNNDVITCFPDYWECSPLQGNDDHILCSTANNSAHYEFVFDDITENKDDSKYKTGIGAAYCKIFFEGFLTTLFESGKGAADSNDKTACKPNAQSKVYTDKQKIFAQCKNMGNTMSSSIGYKTTPDTNLSVCPIDFGTVQCSQLVNKLGIDNKFNTLQINLDYGTIALLAGYVQNKYGPVSKFKCNIAPSTCKTGGGMMNNPDDDYLTCYADGKRIDFWFDDLSESKASWSQASKDGLQCINNDGIYDGRRCHGISKEGCDKLKNNGVRTRWDDKLASCVLVTADGVANMKRLGEIASTVGVAAGIVVITVGTGGSTTMILLATAGYATSAVSEKMKSLEQQAVEAFTIKINNCTNRRCIGEQIEWFINEGSNYMNNLTDDQINAVDKSIAKGLTKLQQQGMKDEDINALTRAFETSTDKGIIERCTGNATQGTKCAFDVATVLFDFLPVSRAALKTIPKFFAKSASSSAKLENTAAALLALIKPAKGVAKSGKTIKGVLNTTIKGKDTVSLFEN